MEICVFNPINTTIRQRVFFVPESYIHFARDGKFRMVLRHGTSHVGFPVSGLISVLSSQLSFGARFKASVHDVFPRKHRAFLTQ